MASLLLYGPQPPPSASLLGGTIADLCPVLTVKPVPLPSRLDAVTSTPSPSLMSSHSALRAQEGVAGLQTEWAEPVIDSSTVSVVESPPSVDPRLWVVPQGQPDRSSTPAETVRSRLCSSLVQDVWDDIVAARNGFSRMKVSNRCAHGYHNDRSHGLTPLVSTSPSAPPSVVEHVRLAVMGSLAFVMTDESKGTQAFKSVACDAMMVVLALLSDGDQRFGLNVRESLGALGYILTRSHEEVVRPMLDATVTAMRKREESIDEANEGTLGASQGIRYVVGNVVKMCNKFLA